MREYNGVMLEEEDVQVLESIFSITGRLANSLPFLGDIKVTKDQLSFEYNETFFFENNRVIGLIFYETVLRKLPENFGSLSSLKFLEFIDCTVQDFSSSFGCLNELEDLSFIYDNEYGNDIIELDLPDAFKNLKNLRQVLIRGVFVVFIPPSFTALENLEKLYLNNCLFSTHRNKYELYKGVNDLNSVLLEDIYDFPEDINKLTSLQHLDIRNISFLFLPNSLAKLPSLKKLILENINKVQNIEVAFEISSLEKLVIANCKMELLPKSIQNLTNLKHLSIPSNRLKNLPFELFKCKNLEILAFTFNRFEVEMFKEWLKNLTNLPKLKLLYISEYFAEYIPNELKEKKELKVIIPFH